MAGVREGDPAKRRRRRRTIILLPAWAACCVLVADLLLNIPQLDRVRPDSGIYRAARRIAHDLSGQPYEEPNGLVRVEVGPSAAETKLRARIETLRRNPETLEPTLLSSDQLEQIDLGAIKPPPQYRGTPLEWRLHGKMQHSELNDLMRSARRLHPRERRALLSRLQRDAVPSLAQGLVELHAQLPDGPTTLLQYSYAVLATLERVAMSGAPLAPAGIKADLVGRLLESLSHIATRFGTHLRESNWGGVFDLLRRLQRVAPAAQDTHDNKKHILAIKESVEEILRDAALPEPNYMGGLAATRVAVFLGDETTWDILFDLLRARHVFVPKIVAEDTRRGLAFARETAGVVIQLGTERQWADLAAVLIEGTMDAKGDDRSRTLFVALCRRLLRALPAESDSRIRMSLEQVLEGRK